MNINIFQFTPLREGLLVSKRTCQVFLLISIHAPARGASTPKNEKRLCLQISIHAPARGASKNILSISRHNKFQFTPLREGLPFTDDKNNVLYYISIHAPARGASWSGNSGRAHRNIFQFTPLREGLLSLFQNYANRILFQFTPLREGLRALQLKMM